MKINKDKIAWIMIGIGVLIFFELFGILSPVCEGDTETYLTMSSVVPPLYPLFLALMRWIFGAELYLKAVVVIQGLLGSFSVLLFTYFIKKQFQLNFILTIMVQLGTLIPFGINTMWDAPRFVLTRWILTEAVTIPLFYIFTYFLLKGLFQHKNLYLYYSTVICVIMTLIRVQSIFCMGFTLLALLYMGLLDHKFFQNAIKGGIMMLLAFVVISAGGKCYKYALTGETESAFYQIHPLVHLIYSSDEEDASLYEEPEMKELYLKLYGQFEEMKYTYHFSGDGFYEKGNHYGSKLGEAYRLVQSELMEYNQTRGTSSEESASDLIQGLSKPLYKNVGTWLWSSLQEFPLIMTCSIYIIYPPLKEFCFIFTLCMFAIAIGMTIMRFRKDIRSKAALFMSFVILFMIANALITEFMIRFVARYYLYTYGMFYIALLLLLVEVVKEKEKVEKNNGHVTSAE